MSEQYPGGWVTKTPPTPANNYQATPAPGLWTMTQQAQLKVTGLWPSVGVLPPTFWWGLLNPPNGYTQANGGSPANSVATDPNQDIYLTSLFSPSAGPFIQGYSLYKITKNGAISWVQNYGYGVQPSGPISTFADTSGSLYMAQQQADANIQLISKRSQSTGSIIWATQSAYNGNASGGVTGPDSGGSVYMLGYGDGNLKGSWAKFNSTTGAVIATVGGLDGNGRGYGYFIGFAHADPSGNVYSCGSTLYEPFYARLNSSGVVSVFSILGPGNFGSFMATAFDTGSTPSNFYMVGYPGSPGPSFNIYKVSTSNGTSVGWSHTFSSLDPFQAAIAVDSSSNVFLLARDSSNTKRLVLIRFNSSGVVQFARYIENSASTSASVCNLIWDPVANVLVLTAEMNFSGPITKRGFVMRIPVDGSLTGTYGTVTYATASYSSGGAGHGTWSSASMTPGSWSAGFTAGTGTNSTKAPTFTLTAI